MVPGVTRRAGTGVEERGPLAALDAGVVRIPSKDEASLPVQDALPRGHVLARVKDRCRYGGNPRLMVMITASGVPLARARRRLCRRTPCREADQSFAYLRELD